MLYYLYNCDWNMIEWKDMLKSILNSKFKYSLCKINYVLVIKYVICVCVCWLFGYWVKFDIFCKI